MGVPVVFGSPFFLFQRGYIMLARTLLIFTAVTFIATAIYLAGGRSIPGHTAGASPAPTPGKAKKPVREITLVDGWDGVKIVKTDAEWKKVLTKDEYYILRKQGTEQAYTGELTDNKKEGIYYCAACGLAVFSSKHKYDSETGWPSFYQPFDKKNIGQEVDRSIPEEVRTEVHCERCGGHLGHVFDDGPEPTGLRYCINSAALRFKASK